MIFRPLRKNVNFSSKNHYRKSYEMNYDHIMIYPFEISRSENSYVVIMSYYLIYADIIDHPLRENVNFSSKNH